MQPEPGQTTQDLLDLGRVHPAERNLASEDTEEAAARFGRRCFRSGIGLAVTVTILMLSFGATGYGHDLLRANPDTRLFISLSVIAAGGVAAGLTAVGGIDRVVRPIRALQRQILLESRDKGNRIRRIETAMQLVADELPAEKLRQYWKGSADAVREALHDQQTGTDGPGSGTARSAHLGIVRPSTPR